MAVQIIARINGHEEILLEGRSAEVLIGALRVDCGNPDCVLHGKKEPEEEEAQCWAVRSDGKRCILRSRHHGTHLILGEEGSMKGFWLAVATVVASLILAGVMFGVGFLAE